VRALALATARAPVSAESVTAVAATAASLKTMRADATRAAKETLLMTILTKWTTRLRWKKKKK